MITMYPGIVNSPKALLSAAIAADATSLMVDDGAKLPAAPNLAVLGVGDDAETILYTVKSGNVISGITRAVQGAAKVWPANTIVARNFTEKDYAAIKDNIEALFAVNEINRRNLIINGNFDIWQRGTTQTIAGYGSDDRWSNWLVSTTATFSRQDFAAGQTDVPNNPKYFSRAVVTSANSAGSRASKAQLIEDVTILSGKTVTLSFWAKANANKTISIEFTQAFGTGGTAAIQGIDAEKFSITSNWQRFTKTVTLPSVSGKTIGTSSYTQIVIWFDAGSDYNARTNSLGNQSGTFDISQVQLNLGAAALPFDMRDIGTELLLCKRYAEIVGLGISGIATSAVELAFVCRYQEKRTNPTLTLLNTAPSIADMPYTGVKVGASSTIGYSAGKTGMQYCTLSGFTGLTTSKYYLVYTENLVLIDAEL